MKLKKIILLIILGIILIAAGFMAYLMLTTRSHSPAEKLEYSEGDFTLTVDYCRPYKKGRLIFGEESEGALLPYGGYWRTGANEATEIEFNKDLILVFCSKTSLSIYFFAFEKSSIHNGFGEY